MVILLSGGSFETSPRAKEEEEGGQRAPADDAHAAAPAQPLPPGSAEKLGLAGEARAAGAENRTETAGSDKAAVRLERQYFFPRASARKATFRDEV